MIHQNLVNNDSINRWGCLFMALGKGVEDHAGRLFRHQDIIDAYDLATRTKLPNGDPVMTPTCFVNSHPEVMRIWGRIGGARDLQATYLGAFYSPWVGRNNWGVHRGANFIIIQGQTSTVSHFRGLYWDPYEPNLELRDVMSVRYYRIAA